MKGMKKLFALFAVLALALTLTPVLTANAAIQPVLTSVESGWEKDNQGNWYFAIKYTAANVQAGTLIVLESADGYPIINLVDNIELKASDSLRISATDVINSFITSFKDSFLKLSVGASDYYIPVKFLNVTSTFKAEYFSGEPVNAATGTITAFDQESIFTATGNTATFALVAVWKDDNGNTHSAKLPSVITATAETPSTATFSVAEKAFRFIAPAGKVYLVPGYVADGLTNGGKVVLTGASNSAVFDIEKFAYEPISINKSKLGMSPGNITLPPTEQDIYLYDQYGRALSNTPVKVELGYKDENGVDAPAMSLTTGLDGKLHITFPKPIYYGAYTGTISTVVGSSLAVDGYTTFTISYGAGLVLADSIVPTPSTATIHQIGAISIGVYSTAGGISKLWIEVDDPDEVLKVLKVLKNSKIKIEPQNFTPTTVYSTPFRVCGKPQETATYWQPNGNPPTSVVLEGVAQSGGTFKVTVKAELTNGAIVKDTKEYVVKAYRISVNPGKVEYGKSADVVITVKDWYGSPVDNLVVQLVGPNTVYTLVGKNFGKYTFTIPSTAEPGSYSVRVNGYDYGEFTVFEIGPQPEALNLQLPKTVNAMDKFEVKVTDKNNNPINAGTWTVGGVGTKNTTGSGPVLNGRFIVDTSVFPQDSPLGEYVITAVSSDGKYSGSATVAIVAPFTVTPTVVTHGLTTVVAVELTSTAFNASLIQATPVATNPDIAKVTRTGTVEHGSQTATFSVKLIKNDLCTLDKMPKVKLTYGNFILTTDAVGIGHPKLSFVQTATWYMGDTVPMKVKVVDAMGNPVSGALVKVEHFTYFNLTATTNAEGIADFGNVTLPAAGNVVASLVMNPDGEYVYDFRSSRPALPTHDYQPYKVTADVFPARPTQDLKVTVTPTVVDPGKDAMISLTLIGADDKPVETGKSVVVTIGPSTYNGLIGANGVVSFNVKGEAFTGTTVVGVVKVEGYNSATFTIAVTEKPEVKTVIELAPGMDIYTVNGETKFWDATPYIKEGRTLVPIRHLAEAVGFKASWDFSDPANKMVFIFKADQDPEKDKEHPFILLIIGQPTAMVNGNLVALDVAPEILNGRTMVPLRFVVETLGYQVEWLGNTIRLMK